MKTHILKSYICNVDPDCDFLKRQIRMFYLYYLDCYFNIDIRSTIRNTAWCTSQYCVYEPGNAVGGAKGVVNDVNWQSLHKKFN